MLQSKYLWLIVSRIETCPPNPDNTTSTSSLSTTSLLSHSAADIRAERKDYMDWRLRDTAVQGFIKGAIEKAQYTHVQDLDSSKAMWAKLKQVHVTNMDFVNIHYLFEELYTKKFVEGTSMSDHIANMRSIRNRITDAGESLPEIHVARALVLSLPQTQAWDVVKIDLFGKPSTELNLSNVQTRIMLEVTRREKDKSSADRALHVSGKKKSSANLKDGKRARREAGADDKCYSCQGKGHFLRDCPEKKDEKSGDRDKKGGSGNANHTTLTDLGARQAGRVYMTSSAASETLLDCACDIHIWRDKDAFIELKEWPTGEYITVADDRKTPVVGKGTIKIRCKLPGRYQDIQ